MGRLDEVRASCAAIAADAYSDGPAPDALLPTGPGARRRRHHRLTHALLQRTSAATAAVAGSMQGYLGPVHLGWCGAS
jgi:hypothetical protein